MDHIERVIVIQHENNLNEAISLAASSGHPFFVISTPLAVGSKFLSNDGFNFGNRAAVLRGMLKVPFVPSKRASLHFNYIINYVVLRQRLN